LLFYFKGESHLFQKVQQRISHSLSLKVTAKIVSIVILLIGLYYYFIYSPYLTGLSASENRLYQNLKTTGDMQSLQGIEAATAVKLFLYSIEKEDWNVSSLFYDINGDGTISTAFGPVTATPDVLKRYRWNFIGEKDSFQAVGKHHNGGYIVLQDPKTVVLYRYEGVWYIYAFNEQ